MLPKNSSGALRFLRDKYPIKLNKAVFLELRLSNKLVDNFFKLDTIRYNSRVSLHKILILIRI